MIDPMQHVGLVRVVAQRYTWSCSAAMTIDDLVQEGMQGLLRAIETFDPERGAFSTYAMPWVRHYVQRAAYAHCRLVRVPMPVAKAAWKRGERFSLGSVSMDAPINYFARDSRGGQRSSEDAMASVGDVLARKLGFFVDAEGPKNVEDCERRELVAHLLSTLTEREQTVLRLRFFEDLTLHETGRRIGTTKERARQIQAEALRRIETRLRREAAE